MSATQQASLPFLLFQVRAGLYAVNSRDVREIVMLPKVVSLPDAPPEIRGVINLRGRVMHLVDLRVKLGFPSAKTEIEDLIRILTQREQDHRDWLGELESCVLEHRPFNLARDPKLCKFGQWYARFNTENTLLKMALRKMDEPHRLIHATADEVLQKVDRGDQEGAMQLLVERRARELATLSNLFEDARRTLREHHRELAVVFARGEKRFAISIDVVEAVERIPEENVEPIPASMLGKRETVPLRIAKRVKTNQTILLLDEEFLFSAAPAPGRN